jgi:ABC-type transport system substrate-binding protein
LEKLSSQAESTQSPQSVMAEANHRAETPIESVNPITRPEPVEGKSALQTSQHKLDNTWDAGQPIILPAKAAKKGGIPAWAFLLGGVIIIGLIASLLGLGGWLAMEWNKKTATPVAQLINTAVVILPPTQISTTISTTSPTALSPTAMETPVVNDSLSAKSMGIPMKVVAPDCNYGGEFKSIEAVDANTVKFTLCNPDPAFPAKVAFSGFAIQNKEYLDANGGDSVKMSDKPNGTGPYILKEWKRGDSITFEANPNYWGPKPAYKTLVFRWSTEAAQRLLELQSGTADGIDNVDPNDFATVSKDTTLQLKPREALNIAYIGFNVDIAPFNNVKVRQALAMAIDRQRIVDQYYPKGSVVANSFVPDAFNPGPSPAIKYYDYNKDQAKNLLTDAGFNFNQVIQLSYRNVNRGYLPTPDKVAQEIQAQLAEIGVKVKLNEVESTTFLDQTASGKLPFYLLGWTADYPDSSNFYNYHFATDSNKQFGTEFPDLVKQINAASQISDVKARQADYDKVNQLLKDNVPMIPLAHGGSATAWKASVKGANSSPLGEENFSGLQPGADQVVWLQNGEPGALWCVDETDGESLRACSQLYDSLLGFKTGGTDVIPALAQTYESNTDLTVWTFHLRQGVKFTNGAILNANDVVATYLAAWDAASSNHKGRTATFEYFNTYFGNFLNAPKK